MTRVIALGSSGKIDQLWSALQRADPNLKLDLENHNALEADRAREWDVALIAPDSGTPQEIQDLAGQAQSLGLPAVVLLPTVGLFDLDPTRGILEFCFPPFSAEEVAVRIRHALARTGQRQSERRIVVGDLAIDQDRYEVTVSGRKVDLTYKEYELLKVLAASPGRVFSREVLLRTVWEYDYFGGTRTVDVHVRRLRAKINDINRRFIETVWNVGYRFRAPEAPDIQETPDL